MEVGVSEKQSILDAMEHLLARYLEMRPLFFAPAFPMNEEWKMRPYLGVFPRVLRALKSAFSAPRICTHQGSEVGRHGVHLGAQVLDELFAVLGQRDHAVGKPVDVDEVDDGNVHPHGGLAGVDDCLGLGRVHDNLLQRLEDALRLDLLMLCLRALFLIA